MRPTWAEVDLRALRLNLAFLRGVVSAGTRVIAVVKANAYGHGAVAVARELERAGVDGLAVAIAEEGAELRAAGIRSPILLLNGFWPGQEDEVIRSRLTATVYAADMVSALARTGRKLGQKARYQIKVDTGLGRLGVDWEDSSPFVASCQRGSGWAVCEGIYTHLSAAEIVENQLNRRQLRRFRGVLASLGTWGSGLNWIHAANSAALLNFPDSRFNAVRPGLAVYGVNPLGENHPLALEAALSFKTRIMQLKRVKKGAFIGYGGDHTVSRRSVIATLPVGYADGLNRLMSNCGCVLIRGQRAPIIGRISMDLTLVDVTDLEAARVGDEVVLIGNQNGAWLSVQEVAQVCHTIPYEILCGIGPRVPRVYLNPANASDE
ncbi:MAG: alanine racemase [Acidobacteriota bacterium]